MDNSLKKKRKHRKRTPPAKGKIKPFLIGKELKTTDLRQTRQADHPKTQNQSDMRSAETEGKSACFHPRWSIMFAPDSEGGVGHG